MRRFVLLAALLGVALIASPSNAQTEGAPLISLPRLSVGAGGACVIYRPGLTQGEVREEFRATLPVSYNLWRYSSLTAKISYGLKSEQKEVSFGLVFHLLARGKRP